MWRINAVRYYQFIAAIVIFVEIMVIAGFAGLVILVNSRLITENTLALFLETAIFISAMIILNLSIYLIGFQQTSNRSDRRYDEKYHEWLQLWAQAFFTDTLPEKIERKPFVMNAYVDFAKSTMRSPKLYQWAQTYGFIELWKKHLASRNKTRMLDAIEALGIVGTRYDLRSLYSLTDSRDLDILIATVTAVARIVSRIDDARVMNELLALEVIILHQHLPVFVIEDIYYILGHHAVRLKTQILSQRDLNNALLLATVNSVTENYEAQFIPTLARFLSHPGATVQIAILRMFIRLNYIPPETFRDVLLATQNDHNDVRKQALKALETTPLYQIRLPLWLSLGDEVWSVRHAAAEILIKYGEDGIQILTTATHSHDKITGREIALQMLKMIAEDRSKTQNIVEE